MPAHSNIPIEHYRLLFETAPGSFLILLPDAHFTIVEASNAYLQDTFTRREQILGRPVFSVFPDNPHTPEAHSTKNLSASLHRVVATKSPDTMAIQRYDVRSPEGDRFLARYWSPVNTPLLSPGGELLYIIHRVQNVTDYVQLRQENEAQQERSRELTAQNRRMEAEILQQSHELHIKNQELIQANEELTQHALQARAEAQNKDEFLAMLAHELRNPLAGIATALQLLEIAGGDPAKARQYQEVCKRQVGNLTHLVNDLLDVSRVSRGAVHLHRESLDMRDVVESALHAMRGTLDERGLTVNTSIAPGAYHLFGDATRLEQVLTNLLANAAKYSEVGGRVDIALAEETAETRKWAVIQIKDTGRGIPADKLSAIFEMFVQVDTTIDRAHGGLGIGLTLVQHLVEMHGGTVSGYSQGLGHGSTFTVRLPLDASNALPKPALQIHSNPAEEGDGLRVLVIEDNVDARETLKSLLEAYGYSVEVAATGEEGLHQLLTLRPDVAIVDIGLPGLDGFEVARRARQTAEAGAIKLVALSGYSGPDTEHKAIKAGFDLHLVKPVNTVELPKILKASPKGRSTG